MPTLILIPQVAYGPSILVEVVDVQTCTVGETVTLMEWGNAVVTALTRNDYSVRRVMFAFVSLTVSDGLREPGHCHQLVAPAGPGKHQLQGYQEDHMVG
jgi:hypothetical protein